MLTKKKILLHVYSYCIEIHFSEYKIANLTLYDCKYKFLLNKVNQVSLKLPDIDSDH